MHEVEANMRHTAWHWGQFKHLQVCMLHLNMKSKDSGDATILGCNNVAMQYNAATLRGVVAAACKVCL